MRKGRIFEASRRPRSFDDLFSRCFPVFIGLAFALIFFGSLFESRLAALLARGGERRLHEGTAKAYGDAAAVDLRLAHKAIRAGAFAVGEDRLAKAQDKIYAPQMGGQAPVVVAQEMKGLEASHGKEFKAIRLKRALGRLGPDGAEVPASGSLRP
jgi:hypothetical protein